MQTKYLARKVLLGYITASNTVNTHGIMGNMRMNKLTISVVLVIMIGLVAIWLVSNRQVLQPITKQYEMVIKDTTVYVELADTNQKRIRGLSGRSSLGADEGLLFIFYSESFPSIWMKDMQFPIDIIWLNKDLEVVDIKKNATPESYPEVFIPARLAQYVLELNAGFVNDHNIEEGDVAQVKGLSL